MGKLSKAWAGGIAGAVVGAAGYVYGGGSISQEVGKFIGSVVTGFVGGFLVVFISPANKTR